MIHGEWEGVTGFTTTYPDTQGYLRIKLKMKDFWCQFGKDIEHKVLITSVKRSKTSKAQWWLTSGWNIWEKMLIIW